MTDLMEAARTMTGRDAADREYTHRQEILDNVPYLLMVGTGSLLLAMGFRMSAWGWTAGALYAAYGVAGAFWIMVFVCPYCPFHGTRKCPCGYGQVAASLRPKNSEDRFREKFRKHIPVIVPLWFIPVIAGAIFLLTDYRWPMLVLLLAFVVDSFVILPLVSRRYGCSRCSQKARCPWMGERGR
jgi:hypothetical protein